MTHLPVIEKATPADYDEIMLVWEASVRATHDFLKEEDLQLFRPLIRNRYLQLVDLYLVRDEAGAIEGFLGTSPDKIEMLFLRPESRSRGLGKLLLLYATKQLGIAQVDVNEQNEGAVGFYLHMGFRVIHRSEVDGMGKPYPILSMELEK